MTSKRVAILGSLVAAAAIFLPTLSIGAGAASMVEFRSSLEASGYVVSAGEKTSYTGLQASGTAMTVRQGSAQARIELFEYAGETQLHADWDAVAGQSPKPRNAGTDLGGRAVYWNRDSVAVIDFRAPNDAALARLAGETFLRSSGTGLASSVSTSIVDAQRAPLVPPSTGEAGLADESRDTSVDWLELTLLCLVFAAGGALMLTSGASRYRSEKR